MEEPTLLEDALSFVRTHPEMFFAGSRPNPLACIKNLVVEVIALGSSDTRVLRMDGWWVLSSDFDWFGGIDVRDVFKRLIPIPVVAPNASRVEIVLAAFAESVATYGTSTGRLVVQGQAPSEELWSEMMKGTRAIAFQFPE